MYVLMHIHAYNCTQNHTHTRIYICIYIYDYNYIYKYLRIHTQTYMYIYIYAHMHHVYDMTRWHQEWRKEWKRKKEMERRREGQPGPALTSMPLCSGYLSRFAKCRALHRQMHSVNVLRRFEVFQLNAMQVYVLPMKRVAWMHVGLSKMRASPVSPKLDETN
jgi:hypothetical protein